MKCFLFIALLIVINSVYSSNSKNPLRIVCYFDSSAPIRKGDAKFTADDIDLKLCTHLVYSHAILNFVNYDIISTFPQRDVDNKGYKNVTSLKINNPHLKVLISLEDSNAENTDYSNLYKNNTSMNTLIKNTVNFLDKFTFDGLVLDFVRWTRERAEFVEALVNAFPKNKYVVAGRSQAEPPKSENVNFIRLSRNLDFLNLYTYRYYHPDLNLKRAVHHAPLYGKNTNKSADITVNKWTTKGFPADKIVMGIPFVGYSWTLSSNETKPPAPANGHGIGTIEDGSMAYYEICRAVRNEYWQEFQDSDQRMGPYAVSPIELNKNRIWVGYDDPAMAVVKAKYILSKGLGGAMISDISMDDFRNICGGGKNPMLMAIWNTLTLPDPGWPGTICIPSKIAFALPSVILCSLLLILTGLLVKIFCRMH